MTGRSRDLVKRFPGLWSISRNAATFVLGEWTEALVRAVYAVLIARWLGPEQYGWWSYALAFAGSFITLSGMGTELLLPARVGRDRAGALPFLDTSLLVRLLLLAAGAAVLAGWALVATAVPIERAALLLLLPMVLARGISNWLRTMAIGFEQARSAMQPVALVRIAELVAGLVLLMAGADVLVLFALHSASWIIEVAVITPRLRRLAPVSPRLHRAELREVLGKGWIVGLASALTGLLFALPVILLRHHLPDIATVGQFGLAMQLAMFVVMALQGVSTAAQAVLSRAVANADDRARMFGHVYMLGCLLLAGPAWLGAHWLGVPVVTAILGEQYRSAGELLPTCIVFAVSVMMAAGYWQLLVLHGRNRAGALANGAAVLLLAGAIGPLVTAYGAPGAAYAGMAAGALRAVVLLVLGFAVPRQKST